MRVLIYVQHLSGVGHFVRAFEIARALATRHEVCLVDGGWPVPRSPAAASMRLVELPRIHRLEGQLVALSGAAGSVDQRPEILAREVASFAPDLVLIEHFPFSKHELRVEVRALVATARARGPAKVVSSIRDLVPPGRFDLSGAVSHEASVRAELREFDLLLVHSDPRFARLEDSLPWASELPLAVHYTGFVAESHPGPFEQDATSSVVLSAGGHLEGLPFLRAAIAAWRELSELERGGHTLEVFAPLRANDSDLAALRRELGPSAARVHAFGAGFLERLSSARLSISRAGYNTCTNLLFTRCRAVLCPDRNMSDQLPRARRFAERRLAQLVEHPSPATIARAIQVALEGPTPEHDLDLRGAENTVSILEHLVSGHIEPRVKALSLAR